MASISMNPVYGDRATYVMMTTLKHSHQLAMVKGVLVMLAILAVGFFTMTMPWLRPASEGARSVATERQGQTEADAYLP